MEYDGLRVYDCEVNENDWLDVSFVNEEKIDGATKKLVNNEGKNQRLRAMLDKVGKAFKGKPKMIESESVDGEADGEFDGEENYQRPYVRKAAVREASANSGRLGTYAKAAALVLVIALLLVGMRFVDNGFAGDVFNYAKTTYISTVNKPGTEYMLVLPSTAEVSISEGSDIVFSGGSIVSCIEEGTVFEITEDSVTVKVNDRLFMTYLGLSEILVQEGEQVSKYGALGRYVETAIVTLTLDGEKVTNVSLNDFVLVWAA